MLSSDDNLILDYLKPLGKQYATAKEVCRRAGGKSRWSTDPDWAKPLLKRLETRGVLETNALGHYRIRRKKDNEKGIPMDPRIRDILTRSGQDFTNTYILTDDGDDVSAKNKKG